MVRHFAALKVRLLVNGLRGKRGRLALVVLAPVFGLAVVAPVFGLLAGVDRSRDALTIATMVFAGAFAGWIVIPIVGFGSDETLDVANLSLLPIAPRQLASGLLAASAIGLGPLGTFAALLGAVVGFGDTPAAVVVALLAVLLTVAACIVGSRALVTVLSGLLRSRRGRDLAISIGALLGVGIQLARFAVVDRRGRLRTSAFERAVPWLIWTPPGLTAKAMVLARDGSLLPAAGALVAAAAEVVVLAVVWVRVLEGVLTTAETGTQSAVITAGGGSPMFPPSLRFLPRTRTGVVAVKELRYLARDPRRRSAIIPALVLPLIPILSVLRAGETSPKIVVAAAFTSLLAALVLFNNQFGSDGGAYWLHVVVDGGARADLAGKNLAALSVGVPIPLIAGCLLAAITHGWRYLPFTIVVAAGVFGVLLGVGNVVSVRMPQALPESRSNMWAARSGQGCGMALIGMLVLAAELVVLVPVVIGVVVALTGHSDLLFPVAVASALYGAAVWSAGLTVGSRWLDRHQPEMLQRLTPV
jgi:ABC-2 type transport system permease protein